MKIAKLPIVFIASVLCGPAVAQIETAPPLPLDEPQTMRGMEAVCTGIGQDAREDPRWAAYPLRIEIAGRDGQFLGDAQVTLTKGGEAVVSVHCSGPWVLFQLPPGAYGVTAEIGGVSKTARTTVGGRGQTRVVLRFPEEGGAVSPEFKPKT